MCACDLDDTLSTVKPKNPFTLPSHTIDMQPLQPLHASTVSSLSHHCRHQLKNHKNERKHAKITAQKNMRRLATFSLHQRNSDRIR